MKITGVEVMTVALPPRREHPTAYRLGGLGRYVIVQIQTDEGISGLGEATVLPSWGGDYQRYFGETPETTIHLIRDYFTPLLVDEHPFEISRLMAKLNTRIRGYPYAKAAIDIALHDLKGKALGVPVYELLGGAYRREIPMAHSIGILETERVVNEAVKAVEEGIKTIKLKIGKDAERDLAVICDVRQAVGPRVAITVDANRGFPNVKAAIRFLRKAEEQELHFAEQMVEGIDGLAAIARSVDTPIMADESAWTAVDVLEIAQKRAADLVSIYTTKPGGFLGAMQISAICQATGIVGNVNGSAETGVGTAANLHLAAASPVVTEGNVFPITRLEGREPTQIAGAFYLDDIVQEGFDYRDGNLIIPDRPGLGVELDPAKIEKYRVG